MILESGPTTAATGVVITVSGSAGATLPTGATEGTTLIYSGQLDIQTDTVTIPSGEAVWYRTQAGSSSRIVGASSFSVNRQTVMLVKFPNEWRVVGLYYV